MLMATDFLLVGFPSLKTFTLRKYAFDLSFCAEPKAKSQNPSTRGIKYYLDSPLRKKTTPRVSITPPKIDKILERTILL